MSENNGSEYAASQEGVMQVHAFYYYDDKNLITLDVVPKEDVKDMPSFIARIEEALHRHFPAHHFSIIGGHNYSE